MFSFFFGFLNYFFFFLFWSFLFYFWQNLSDFIAKMYKILQKKGKITHLKQKNHWICNLNTQCNNKIRSKIAGIFNANRIDWLKANEIHYTFWEGWAMFTIWNCSPFLILFFSLLYNIFAGAPLYVLWCIERHFHLSRTISLCKSNQIFNNLMNWIHCSRLYGDEDGKKKTQNEGEICYFYKHVWNMHLEFVHKLIYFVNSHGSRGFFLYIIMA